MKLDSNRFKERTWSLFSDRPMFMYSKKHDQYFVLWSGEIMSREEAIYVILKVAGRVYPGIKVRRYLFDTYVKMYKTGLTELYTANIENLAVASSFENDSDNSSRGKVRFNIISNKIGFVYRSHLKKFSLQEMLEWFHYDQATVCDD